MKNKTTRHRITKIIIYVAALLLLGAGSIITGLFDTVDSTIGNLHLSLGMLLKLVIMGLLMLIIENLCIIALDNVKPKSSRASTMVTIVKSTVRYLAVIICLFWALTIIGVDVSTIFASVGILALIIGFGAESMIADVVTGVFMLFEGQYNVGDIVETNGFRGTVRSIGVRTTTIEDVGGNVRIVNNSNMTNILNRSNNNSVSVCTIGIPYSTDLEALEEKLPEMLYSIYINHTDVFKKTPQYLGVDELGQSAVVLKFIAEVDEANIYNGNRVLNHDLLISFKKMGIEVPYGQLDVHVK